MFVISFSNGVTAAIDSDNGNIRGEVVWTGEQIMVDIVQGLIGLDDFGRDIADRDATSPIGLYTAAKNKKSDKFTFKVIKGKSLLNDKLPDVPGRVY